MSNACGRLLGTIGSGTVEIRRNAPRCIRDVRLLTVRLGVLYTYVGADHGPDAGSDALAGLAACFIAGTARGR